MEKIKINYKGSWVKTTKNVGAILIILGITVTIVLTVYAYNSYPPIPLWYTIIPLAAGFISGLPLLVLSTIAKSLLISNIQRDRLLKAKGIELAYPESNNVIDWLKQP